MNALTVLERCRMDGITLIPTGRGTLHFAGPAAAVKGWGWYLKAEKPCILALLQLDALAAELQQSIEERAVCMQGQVMQQEGEAVELARQVCWNHFQRVVGHILEQRPQDIPLLVNRYRNRAIQRYGRAIGERMAREVESWIRGRPHEKVCS